MSEENTIVYHTLQYEAIIDLLSNITSEKKKINDKLFLISSAYDKIYKKYNMFSLSLLILSSITTAFEALRLSIIDLLAKQEIANIDATSFVMNTIILSLGAIITILSGIVRFRNYRETLEQLKDIQAQLIVFRDKYHRKFNKILNLLALDSLTDDEIKIISEKIEEYDANIANINISQHIRNDDILKYKRYKADFDFQLRKIVIDKNEELQNYEKLKGLPITHFEMSKLDSIDRFVKLKRFKDIILKIEEDSITEIGLS